MYGGLITVPLLVFRVGGGMTVGDLLLLAAFALTILEAPVAVRNMRITWSGLSAFFLVLVGGFLSSLASKEPEASLMILVRVLLVAFIVPWTFRSLLNTPERLKRGLLAFAVGAAICGGGSLVQLMLGDVIPGSEGTNAGRYPGFAVHVSDTGGITSMAAVYGVGMLYSAGVKGKLWGAGIAAFGIIGLVLSGSVSGMMAAAVGIFFALVWHRMGVAKLVLTGGVLYFGAVLSLRVLPQAENALNPWERFLQVTGETGTTATLNTSATRWDSILRGWEGFLKNPLTGAGLEPAAAFTDTGFPPHNLVVAALFQGGILFTAGILVVVLTTLWKVMRKRKAGGTITTAAAGLIAAIVFAMTAPSFFNRYFWIPVAIAAVASLIKTQRQRRQSLRPVATVKTLK